MILVHSTCLHFLIFAAMKKVAKHIAFVIIGLFLFSLIDPAQTFKTLLDPLDNTCNSVPAEETEDSVKLSEEKAICGFYVFNYPSLSSTFIRFSPVFQAVTPRYFKIISPPPESFI